MDSTASIDRLVTDALQSVPADAPILETLARMHGDNQARSGLDDRTYVLVRLAALVALNASVASYIVNFAAADEVGVGPADVQGVLIALAPVVGGARTVCAAENAMQAINVAQRS